MNIHCVLTVARQVQGEYIFIKTERAFKDAAKANDLMQVLKSQYTSKDGATVPVTLMTPHGEITCHCEIGVFEVNLED